MTAPTGLGQYNKPQGSQGDRIQAQQMLDRPLLVWVRKTQFLNRTKFSADGGEAVYIDFVDLLSNQAYIEVMWMAGAIVDGLKQYAGDGNAYPVKVVQVAGGKWGKYQTIESLSEDPQWMGHIQANLAAFQNLVQQTRAAKEQEWAQAMRQPPAPPAPNGPPPPPALAPAAGAAAPQYGATPEFQQTAAQYGVPQQAPPAPVQQPAQDPAYAAWLASQGQPPAAAPPAQQYSAPPPAIPDQQPQYQQPQAPPAQVAPPQYQQQAPPAAAPPQYAPGGAVPGPPPAQQYPQQQQQPAAPPAQFGAPPAGPPQQYGAPAPAAGPPGLPTPPGAVTGQTVQQLQQQLAALG